MIETEDLVVEYGARTAAGGVSMEVREREIFGVLGPERRREIDAVSECWRTMLEPTRGRARVAGFDVEREATEVRRRIGVVFQSQSLDRKLNGRREPARAGPPVRLWGAALGERMEEVMRRLGLGERRQRTVEALSGGLRRRVEIAKGLLHRPAVAADGRTLGRAGPRGAPRTLALRRRIARDAGRHGCC